MGVIKKTKSQGKLAPAKLIRNSHSGGVQGENQGDVPDLRQLIWQAVALIPKGQVATYGQIATLVGFPKHSRYVGSTLRNLPKNTKLPWFRVVNSQLKISQRGGGEARQRRLLEKDGVEFVGDKVAKSQHWQT